MKKQNMLRFFTSIIFIFLFFNKNNSQIVKDTLEIKNKYGLRVGIDISKQIRMLTEEYNGLSLYGDIKIKERLFIVSELGRETKKIINNNLNSEFSGNYIKAGINYNLYNNLPGLNNEIYIGFRVAVSKFESEISQYNIYNKDQFWIPESINDNLTYENLNANWIELIIGIQIVFSIK